MDDTNTDMCWHLNGRTIAKYPTPAGLARRHSQHARDRRARAQVVGLPRGPEPLRAVGRRLRRAGDVERLAPVHLGRRRRSTTRSGARLAPSWFADERLDVPPEVPDADRAGGQDLHRHHVRAEGRHAVDGVGAGELPALRRAREQQRADVRAERPRGAGPVQRRAGRPTSARRVGARFQVGSAWRRNFTGGTVLVNPTGSTVTVALGRRTRDDGCSTTFGDARARRAARSCAPRRARPLRRRRRQRRRLLPRRLAARVGQRTKVALHWAGLKASRVDVFRNGGRKATVANSGSYTDDLKRKPEGTYSYKVCAAGTSTCTGTIRVTVASAPSAAGDFEPAGVSHRALRLVAAFRAPAGSPRHSAVELDQRLGRRAGRVAALEVRTCGRPALPPRLRVVE